MTDGWLDKTVYERHPVLACTGPGTADRSYADRFTGHITVSAPGSFNNVLALFAAKPCYAPQFVYDPGTRQFAQLIPWTWSGAALEGGGCEDTETNRAGRNVQLEICCRPEDVPNLPDSTYDDIARLIVDLVRDGWMGDWRNVPDYASMTGTTATYDAPQRLHGDVWRGFNGLGAHIVVPCNAHYDWCPELQAYRLPSLIQDILDGNATPVPDPPTYPAPVLPTPPTQTQPEFVEFGMVGGIVQFLQQLLIRLGYLPVGSDDGVYGAQTLAAVQHLQADCHLAQDGVIGPLTQACIAQRLGFDVPNPGSDPWPGRYLVNQVPMQTGGDVWTVQTKLGLNGYDAGGVDIVYGPSTAAAVYWFQVDYGLTADGVVGPHTWNALSAL